jgi:hypothetical protein
VIRLGLRDLADPDFEGRYGKVLDSQDATLRQLLNENNVAHAAGQLRLFANTDVIKRLQGIKTDFALEDTDRRLLDLAAYVLVHRKLAGDLAIWREIAEKSR